jgi:hypothetical protein
MINDWMMIEDDARVERCVDARLLEIGFLKPGG